MALTLAEAAKLSQDSLQRGVIETFVQVSPVLDRIPLLPIQGNAYAYNEEGSLPGVEFRAVNSAYAESTGTVNPKSESLVILGGDADVDTFIVQTRGNLNDQRAVQTAMKVKAASYKYQDAFFNGDTAVDANSFNGLKKRLTGSQVITSGANGAAMNTDAATRSAFFDKLDALLAACPGADVIYAPSQVLSVLRSTYRNATINNWTEDTLTGRRIEVPTWAGVPILDAGKKADQTPVIGSEAAGTSPTTYSLYAVNFAESEYDEGVLGLTNGGLQVDPPKQLETKPAWLGRIEFYTGLALIGAQPAARLSGVIAS